MRAGCGGGNRGVMIFGVDEAGRGPLAGPVVAGAVWLGQSAIAGLADSKKLSAKRRAALEARIMAEAHWAIGVVEAEEIDRINIFAATMLAMTRAVGALVAKVGEPAMVLIDGNKTPEGRVGDWRWAARAIVGGGCDRSGDLCGQHHRQGAPRPGDARTGRAAPALWVGAQCRIWHRAAFGGFARTWPLRASPAEFRAGRAIVIFVKNRPLNPLCRATRC